MVEIFTCNTPAFSFKMELDPEQKTQGIIADLLKNGRTYEPESKLLYERLQPHDVFIDVGAHVGYYSIFAAKAHESIRCYSFEPEAHNNLQLRRNIALNNLGERITTFDVALGRARAVKQLYINADNCGGHGLWDQSVHPMHEKTRAQKPEPQRVFVEPLSGYWPKPQNGGRIWLKMDVEGSETEVLKGFIGKVDLMPYCIISEVNRFALEQMGSSEKEFRTILRDAGYAYSYAHSNFKLIELPYGDTVTNAGLVWNMIFCKEPLL